MGGPMHASRLLLPPCLPTPPPLQAFTLGGSVTKGQGAAKPELGYPARLFQFINATWPHK